ncbi:MAG TPA: hypothetical protein VHB79_38755 [Polyangiaceae bacterium]|nr:hypothetical protein [Polyangiaceae bacterium]
MIPRALGALFLLASGCTIHVIEQPALATTPAPILVAAAPEARPAHAHHEHHRRPTVEQRQPRAPQPAAPPARVAPPPRVARPARADVTPTRPYSKPTRPRPDKPLYVPLHDVGSDRTPGGLTAQPPGELHKVKIPGT